MAYSLAAREGTAERTGVIELSLLETPLRRSSRLRLGIVVSSKPAAGRFALTFCCLRRQFGECHEGQDLDLPTPPARLDQERGGEAGGCRGHQPQPIRRD